MPKTIAIIPARGGSKRIPRKNIKPFHGKPLIAYSIQTALKSNLFDKIIVTTDDEAIATVAKNYGAEVPFIRPSELSDDFTGTTDVVSHALQWLKEHGEEYDYACTIYATAPLLQTQYLIEGFEKLKNSDAANAFSCTTMPFPIQRTFKITSNNRCEMFWPENATKRSQDLEEAYQDAGQFYWTKLSKRPTNIIFGKESIPVVLPRYLVQDIDTPEDWTRAELMYKTLYANDFDRWNHLKQKINSKEKTLFFREKEVYFMSIGKNIGHESYGKENLFLRPVLVYKKLTHTTFLGIPLTSKPKEGNYFFQFSYKKDQISTAMFNQIRVFDIRRVDYYSGKISMNTWKNLETKLQKFLNFTSPCGEDRPTRAQMNLNYIEDRP
jgi:pseudaminic acid cytidylyltransferase